jgi:hypothetical protein
MGSSSHLKLCWISVVSSDENFKGLLTIVQPGLFMRDSAMSFYLCTSVFRSEEFDILIVRIILGTKGAIDTMDGWADTKKPWPLDITAETAGVTIAAKGSIQDPFSQRGLDLTITVQVKELAELEGFFGKPVPLTGLFELSGRHTYCHCEFGLLCDRSAI